MLARKLLLAYGLLLFAAFLLTGRHLGESVVPAHSGDAGVRMMARANHVYLLFSSLLILLAALIDGELGPLWVRLSVRLGRILVALAAFPLLAAFFLEHERFGEPRSFTMAGCVLSLTGTLLLAAKAFDSRGDSPWS